METKIKVLILLLVIVSGVILAYILISVLSSATQSSVLGNNSCNITTKQEIVNGTSMAPLIQNGQKVELLQGYYACHTVQRNDIIIYNYSGDKEPLIKMVKGVPGDKLALVKSNNPYWEISINGKILDNSNGSAYIVTNNQYPMLSLYIDQSEIIPKNTYLILGDAVRNSIDSRVFGLINKQDIIGKAVVA